MEPMSPVLTEDLVPSEVVYAKDQPQYLPLPVIRTDDGLVISRWTFTDLEREAIAGGADIHLTVMTFNNPLQPVLLEVYSCPE